MTQAFYHDQVMFHHCCVSATEPVRSCELNVRDNRYDPVVGVALQALAGALENGNNRYLPHRTAIISLTDFGCKSHIKRVVDALVQMRPRQAFFARASAVMLSTYGSLALGSHGPCFSLSGAATAALLGITVARRLLDTDECDHIILIAADQEHDTLAGTAIIFSKAHLILIDELIKASQDQNSTHMSSSSVLRFWFTLSTEHTRNTAHELQR